MKIYSHPQYLDHQVANGHPERPERLSALLTHLDACGITQDHPLITPTPASAEHIGRAHQSAYMDFLRHSAPTEGMVPIDPDTWLSPGSLSAASLAAGAVCDGIDALIEGQTSRVFCAVRPPGHHAERDAAMGFCVYNSVVVGALAALQHPDIERVAILDFDVHHGNGTVDICRQHPEILVCSSFQHPFYPNRLDNIQAPNIVNTPLAAGSDGDTFRQAITRDWLPALAAHQPDICLISAGFDAHQQDPLANLNLVEDDFAWVTQLIVDVANDYSQRRVLSTLEGGYDLQALASSAEAHLRVLIDSE